MTSSDLFITATFALVTANLQLASPNDFLNWCDENTYSSDPELTNLAANITDRVQYGDTTCYIYIKNARKAINTWGSFTESDGWVREGYIQDMGQARKMCQEYGATLPTIRGEEEQRVLCHFLKRQVDVTMTFLGLHETKLWSNQWIWDDDTSEQYEYLQCKCRPQEVINCTHHIEPRDGVPYHFEIATSSMKRCGWWRCADAWTHSVPLDLFCKQRFTPPGTSSSTSTTPTATTSAPAAASLTAITTAAPVTASLTATASSSPVTASSTTGTTSSPVMASSTTTSTPSRVTTTPPINAGVHDGQQSKSPGSKSPGVVPSLALVIIMPEGARRAAKTMCQ